MDIDPIPDIDNPYTLFKQWYAEAEACPNTMDHTAMTVSTVDEQGQPHSRILLLKNIEDNGFTFFTNSNSHKAAQIRNSHKIALCFFWETIYKQIRINGTASMITPEESDAYFASRARESQIGAWASLQSEELDNEDTLFQRYVDLDEKFAGQEVPRPEHWNGYRVAPSTIEFWLGREHRLHARTLYSLTATGGWTKKGLYP